MLVVLSDSFDAVSAKISASKLLSDKIIVMTTNDLCEIYTKIKSVYRKLQELNMQSILE